MRDRGGFLIWLVYLNQLIPRSRGRKVPKDVAVPNPRIEEVVRASEEVGCRVVDVQPEKRYPRLWFEEYGKGYVVVSCEVGKRELLRILAMRIRDIRRGSLSSEQKIVEQKT